MKTFNTFLCGSYSREETIRGNTILNYCITTRLFVKKSNPISMMKIILAEEYISVDGIHNVPRLCQ